MIKNRKGKMLEFISKKKRTHSQIMLEFGDGGHNQHLLRQLLLDKLVYQPSRGVYAARQ